MMKKIFILVAAILFAAIALYRCNLDESMMGMAGLPDKFVPMETDEAHPVKNYDKRMAKLAKSMVKALKDEEFREVMKEEALRNWDGAPEFLYKNVQERVLLKSGKKIKQHLTKELYKGKSPKKTFLDSLSTDFPSLQIAVRGPLAKWDTENYVPLVVYVPSGFDESADEIMAFDSKGETVVLDLKTQFAQPVIVLGKCERTDFYGILYSEYSKKNLKSSAIPVVAAVNTVKLKTESTAPASCQTPPNVSSFDAQAMGFGIYLEWTFSSSYPSLYTKFIIERSDGLQWTISGTTRHWTNNTSLMSGESYKYYIKVKYIAQGSSCYSDWVGNGEWVVAPNLPPAVSNLSVKSIAPNDIKLKWTNPTGYFNKIKIYRCTAGTAWQNVKIINNNFDNAWADIDDNLIPGNKYEYKVNTWTIYGESPSVFNIDYNATRTEGDHLYLHSLWIEDPYEIESQIYWPPEFHVKAACVDKDYYIDDDIEEVHYFLDNQGMSIRSMGAREVMGINGWAFKFAHPICKWDHILYKDVINIEINERDDEIWPIKKGYFTISVEYAYKDSIFPGLAYDSRAGFTFGGDLKRGDKDLGERPMCYWYKADYTHEYKYGIKVHYTNKVYSNTWYSTWDNQDYPPNPAVK